MEKIIKEKNLKDILNSLLGININNMEDKNYYFSLKRIKDFIPFIKNNKKICKIIPIFKITKAPSESVLIKDYIVHLKINENNKLLFNFSCNLNYLSEINGIWSEDINISKKSFFNKDCDLLTLSNNYKIFFL